MGKNSKYYHSFEEKGLKSFEYFCHFVQNFLYCRNSRKDEVGIILQESCGTCSTKHAFLNTIAEEQNLMM